CARMVELVDTRDLKSRGPGRVRAGSSPAPGTKINNFFGGAVARWPLYYALNGTAPVLSRKLGLISEIDFKGNAKAVAAEGFESSRSCDKRKGDTAGCRRKGSHRQR